MHPVAHAVPSLRLLRRARSLLVAAVLFGVGGTAHAASIVLDAADANGIGDNGGSPFLFSFSSSASVLEVALLEFLDYEALGIAITDENGFVAGPIITSSPAESILFSFAGTTGNYTAHVTGVGAGAFGLQIVPEPGLLLLLAPALAAGWLRGRGRVR